MIHADPVFSRAFSSVDPMGSGGQWLLRPIPPITAAGPRWFFTTFPFHSARRKPAIVTYLLVNRPYHNGPGRQCKGAALFFYTEAVHIKVLLALAGHSGLAESRLSYAQ